MNLLKKFLKANIELKLFYLTVVFFVLAILGTTVYAYVRLAWIKDIQETNL